MTIIDRSAILKANATAHDEYAADHDSACSYVSRPYPRAFYERLFQSVLAHNGKSLADCAVLELGCGTAHNLDFLYRGGATSYTGLDLSEGMLAVARKKHAGKPNVDFVRSPAEEFLTKNPARFDIILSSSFIHHIFDLPSLFEGIRTALRPGGVYVALHEPYRHRSGRFVNSVGLELDAMLSRAENLDRARASFGQRLREVLSGIIGLTKLGVSVLLKPTPGANQAVMPTGSQNGGLPAASENVDYQLNFDFGPGRLFNALPLGLKGDFAMYSYYVHPRVAKLFGDANNYFTFWCGATVRS